MTKTEMMKLEALMAKATMADLNQVRDMYNRAHDRLARETSAKLVVGSRASWKTNKAKFGKGTTMSGIITKINSKTVVLKTEEGNWKVSPSMLTVEK